MPKVVHLLSGRILAKDALDEAKRSQPGSGESREELPAGHGGNVVTGKHLLRSAGDVDAERSEEEGGAEAKGREGVSVQNG